MSEVTSKSWFAVFNNPEEHGYSGTPEEICEKLKSEWTDGSSTRSGAWAYCTSEKGLKHIHMVLCDKKTMRFSAIKKTYAQGMHFEPTKGTKQQADDYINKRGAFEEKGETIDYICYAGEIIGRQGRRTDLDNISDLINDGQKPSEILSDNPKYYTKESIIKKMYFKKRYDETEFIRNVEVVWHYGKSGSGKSFSRKELLDKYGEDEIYYLTTFGSGAFDNYEGQKVLWIDDYRGEFKFQDFLRYIDVYKAELPARYSNVKALWTEVHITSVLTPNLCYKDACDDCFDNIEQLLRRIDKVLYHYRLSDGTYTYMGFSPYDTLYDMQKSVEKMKAFADTFERII